MTIAQQLNVTEFPFEIKNEQGKTIYSETSNGYWTKHQYDANGNRTYFENSNGFWWKSKYDTNGKETYCENSHGLWEKYEFDAKGNEIYFEASNGTLRDNRPKQVELTLAEIATKLNIPLEQLRIKE